MPRKPHNIEELLQAMGSQEHPQDVAHRYELRRSLLCSRFFEGACPKPSRWDRMLTYTAPLVAGGMMVGVFALMAVQVSGEPEVGPQTVTSNLSVTRAPATVSQVVPIRAEDFLSDLRQPTVSLAGFVQHRPPVTHHVPLASQAYVRVQ